MGQNFLKSQAALRKMGEVAQITDQDIVLEIGPGKGALTEKLLARAKLVLAVEKDRDLIGLLEEKFAAEIDSGQFRLINDDILTFQPEKHQLKPYQYKVVANIPYNITGAIFKKFLAEVIQPQLMVLLVQKEVAERIVAKDGKESILSLSVKAYGNPKYMMKVQKRFFSPEPKVDSAIIAVTDISKSNFENEIKEKEFFDLIKAGFAHKRKILRQNLKKIQKNSSQIDQTFNQLKIKPMTRAEDLKIETWLAISRLLSTDI